MLISKDKPGTACLWLIGLYMTFGSNHVTASQDAQGGTLSDAAAVQYAV